MQNNEEQLNLSATNTNATVSKGHLTTGYIQPSFRVELAVVTYLPQIARLLFNKMQSTIFTIMLYHK